MIRSVQHLRATAAEWEANDAVVPEGEIALLQTKSGRVRVKVGDGIRKFSELPSLAGDVESGGEAVVRLRHGFSHRRGRLTVLTVILPDAHDDDFYSEISFDSGESPTEFILSGDVLFTGDGVADGEFMADANTHYTVFIWYDGRMQGVIRGAANA